MSDSYLRKNIRLYPDNDQNSAFFRYAGAMRWAYNEAKAMSDRFYKKTGKTLSARQIRYLIRQERDHISGYGWLKEIPYHIIRKGVANYCEARQRFFKKVSNAPAFKSKDRTRPSFYQRSDSYRKVDRNHIKLTGIRKPVRVKFNMPEKVYDPYVVFDGVYWYLSYAFKSEAKDAELTEEVVGVDVGIKALATVSDGRTYPNINKEERIKKQEKRVKREQRKLSRVHSRNGGSKNTSGYRKQKDKLKKAHRRLKNMRGTYNHEVSKDIVSSRPKMIVVEDLAVKNMMKNKHLAKSIQDCAFNDLLFKIKYKAQRQGTEVVEANRFYPSSKRCHKCGRLRKDLTLKDRIFKCGCGESLDRDMNAALNLKEYGLNRYVK